MNAVSSPGSSFRHGSNNLSKINFHQCLPILWELHNSVRVSPLWEFPGTAMTSDHTLSNLKQPKFPLSYIWKSGCQQSRSLLWGSVGESAGVSLVMAGGSCLVSGLVSGHGWRFLVL